MPGEFENPRTSDLERVTIYEPPQRSGGPKFERFIFESGNTDFRSTWLTWVSLALILVAYPGQALLGMGQDPTELLKSLTPGLLLITLILTVILQWVVLSVNYAALVSERTGWRGIGLERLQPVHIAWAVAFFLAANVILSGMAWLLAQVGWPVDGDVDYLVPTDAAGKVVWVLVSLTAGFCEEVAFRGYLMTRLRLLGRLESWIVPMTVSSLVFGLCHLYQGWSNVLLLSIYGLLFALLYLRTGSLWPAILAHALQNLIHGFWPR